MSTWKTVKHGVLALSLITLTAGAGEWQPGPDWQESPDPLASPMAVPGGALTLSGHQYPKSLNYYLDSNLFNSFVTGLMYDTLLTTHPVTSTFEPLLARRWKVSDDQLTFTFEIDSRARWSDGRPMTAEDVAWTYEMIMTPEHLTGAHKVSLERFRPPTIEGPRTISFTAREVHWKNLLGLASFHILPKHVFEGKDFNKIHFEFPVISGAYRPVELNEGFSVTFERATNWWMADSPRSAHTLNFDRIKYRFFGSQDDAYAAFKKKELDAFAVYASYRWVSQTQGERFDRNWIVKRKIYNHEPIGFQGFAMNMRRKPFDDLRVRKALAHLLNRERMNEVLMYNQYFLLKSYFTDLYNAEHPCRNPEFMFDPVKARALLDEAGWKVDEKSGLRMKDGQPLSITFLTRDAVADKFTAIYKEDLLDAGIQLKIERKDWAAWVRDMDEFNYDMTWAAWGASRWRDPEPMWHSKEADRVSGNNITGFSDPEVDRLIEQQRTIMNLDRRDALLRDIDRRLTEAVPYILLWTMDYTRLLNWNRFGTPPTVLSKYGNEFSLVSYWWLDPDLDAELTEAMGRGWDLPRVPSEVRYDRAEP